MTMYRGFGGEPGFSLDRFVTRGVKWLLLINVAVFCVCIVLEVTLKISDNIFGIFAQNPILTIWKSPVGTHVDVNWLCAMQFFTYMFLHADPWHLVMNMLVLWFFGPPLESRWGTTAFLKFYLFVGFAAGALHGMLAPMFIGSNYYMLGASGAIFACLLAFAIYYPNQQILLWFVVPIPARVLVVMLGIFTFLSLLYGGGPAGGGVNISHLTHLAGLGFGYLWIRLGQQYPQFWLFNNDPGPFGRYGRRGGGGSRERFRDS